MRAALLVVLALSLSLAAAEAVLRVLGTVRNVGPSFSQYDPVYGKSLKPDVTIHRSTPEFEMTLTTNARGFRGPPLPSRLDGAILVIGDSFTMGYGVDDGEEYPALLRAALTEKFGERAPPVVNLGIGNSGNGRALLWLENEADAFEPSMVILQLTGNDLTDNLRERLFTFDAAGSLRRHPPTAPGLTRRAQALIEAVPGLADLYLVGLLREAALALRSGSGEVSAEEMEGGATLTMALLEATLELIEARDWPVFGLLVEVDEPMRSRITRLFERHGHGLASVPAKAEKPELYYVLDGHWNARGHVFVAGLLESRLEGMR